MPFPTYTVATETSDTLCKEALLHAQLAADAAVAVSGLFSGVTRDNGTITLLFTSAPDSGVEAACDAVVASHQGAAHYDSSVITPPALTGDTHNWSPDGLAYATVLRVDLTGDHDLTGIVAPTSARSIELWNVSSETLKLRHNRYASTPANRLLLTNGKDVKIKRHGVSVLVYDMDAQRWRLRSGAGAEGDD